MRQLNVPKGRNLKSLITLWVTLSVSMGSYGETNTFTGNQMLDGCKSKDLPMAWGICSGYIKGMNVMQLVAAARPELFFAHLTGLLTAS
ncbi:hypothetical protein N9W57_08660 [Pseudomonadales bacterium]|nr:hypothetical protein [Pseudomonadales bacterium]|tara:strand:- start:2876 stop:3142 length:267 start_codon:yes stop_codon:yes gene_type:complete